MRIELTRRGDYGIRAMLALAGAPDGQLLPASRIASTMGIPVRFLAHVMADLARAKLVTARTGRGGGYRLARAPGDIHLLDVIRAIEPDGRRRSCVLRGGPCGASGECPVHEVFAQAQAALIEPLARATLADVGHTGPTAA